MPIPMQARWIILSLVIGVFAACSASSIKGTFRPDGLHIAAYAGVARCGAGERPEPALQGQVPAAMRQSNFLGFNCNLDLVGQYQGEGGSWSSGVVEDKDGHVCAYHSTASLAPVTPAALTGGANPVVPRQNPGVPVIDITDPGHPVRTTSLTTPAMMDPWESLKVNARRGLLVADNGRNAGGGPEIDIYDVAQDCRQPRLLASVPLHFVGERNGLGRKMLAGHEGNFSPDGLTFYFADVGNGWYHAIDIKDPSKPRIISSFAVRDAPFGGVPHGLSVSPDGNRAYAILLTPIGVFGTPPTLQQLRDPAYISGNGFMILDTSEVQARKPDAHMKLISATPVRDGTSPQATVAMKIGGKPYMIHVDEGGSSGAFLPRGFNDACAVGLSPFPMARIYDIRDEKHPRQVSKLGLQINDPANCSLVEPDITGLRSFTYGSNNCSVDNRDNATVAACSYVNSGIRVFDIRDPVHPREIAYYNPAGSMTKSLGSNHVSLGQWFPGSPDWCTSTAHFDFKRKMLVTMCQDNGLLVLRFADGVWPMPQSTPSELQN